jgi:predicted TIM-barrel fold metal-dependent hydrolase
MDANGIERAVLSMSSPGVHFGDDAAATALAREVNLVAHAAIVSHPDRFASFASLPLPALPESVHELVFCMDELGFAGVVLESNAHGVYLGNPRMDPIYAELNARRGILFIHPTTPACGEITALGRPRPMIEFLFDTARTVTDLILTGMMDRFPEMSIVVPHVGGVLPLIADRIQGFMRIFGDPDVPTPDVYAALRRCYFDLAGDPFPRMLPALLTIANKENILYGTDYPWTPAPGVTKRVEAIEADSSEWRTSTSNAARNLLDSVRRVHP